MATTVPTSHRDLLDLPVATLATLGPDGRPQLSAVWFLAREVDGEPVIQVSLHVSRQKTKNLTANPVVTFFVLDPSNPMRYLEVRGDAEVTPDADYTFADAVGQKYGVDVRLFDGPVQERVVVKVKPTTVHAVDMSG